MRQAIVTTPRELLKLYSDLFQDIIETQSKLGMFDWDKAKNTKILVSIVNKSKASDTWRFE